MCVCVCVFMCVCVYVCVREREKQLIDLDFYEVLRNENPYKNTIY